MSPDRTSARHARTRRTVVMPGAATSSTVTRQSKQIPILQKALLSRPETSRDITRVPEAINAVASDSPSYALTATPFTRIETGGGLLTPLIMRWHTLDRRHEIVDVTEARRAVEIDRR
jgi:hypothetical protein